MATSILVDNISKQFVLGRIQDGATLRETLTDAVTKFFRKNRTEADTLWALEDISFSVEQGEVVGIIGRNGAGKSTLLKILSKITYPSSGRVSVKGRVASLLEVGTGFHEELTGRENIYLNGSILGMTKKEVDSKLDAIVEFSGVARHIDTPIKRYSSGMRLRLGFAVAAHLDPEVLIVDEVLAVGDAGFQKKCLGVMEELRGGGRTVLFVSHNLAAVENLCTRAIWIENGRIRKDGLTRDVIEAYMGSFNSSDSVSAAFSLLESRKGTGTVQYTGIELLNFAGDAKRVIRSGEELTLRLHYEAKHEIQYPSFGIKLYSELGTLITETSTWHHGIEIPVIPAGTGYIDLEVDCLNLLPAHYYLSLCLTGPGKTIFDVIELGTRIDVEDGNVYRSSRPIDSRYGIVFFPQRWNLSQTKATITLPPVQSFASVECRI
jgi:lipopolysaccharide transport system ATP-binding protein